MDITGIWIVAGILLLAITINRLLRSYLISRALKHSYEENLRRLTREGRPKGRFE
ncbi:MAG TPA: hypothetical protein VLJ21_03210 [Candidatus Binatia bacterium]|nr:hypothetical protein [Candidatus Binatia bacterium]